MNQETLEKPQESSLFNLFDQADETIARNNRNIARLRATREHMERLGNALGRHAVPDVPQMIVEGQRKAQRLGRLEELVGIENFISQASRLECKHVINMLIDRVSTLDGLAPELEDAACSLTRSIEIDGDASDTLRAYMKGRDEA